MRTVILTENKLKPVRQTLFDRLTLQFSQTAVKNETRTSPNDQICGIVNK